MLNQIKIELSKELSARKILIYLAIILVAPLIQFLTVYNTYQFFTPINVFEKTVSSIPSMLFPALAILVYIPTFVSEYNNNFLTYTRPRIDLKKYLIVKGIVNAMLSGIALFLMIFITYILIRFIEPFFGIINYAPMSQFNTKIINTFSFVFGDNPLLYVLMYALWVGLNASLYATCAYILILSLENVFVAITIPFLMYHIFNFVSGILSSPEFSPLSTVFPFNIVAQPIWTVLVPFLTIAFINFLICKLVLFSRKEWTFN